MKLQDTALIFAGALAGAFVLDKTFNDGKITEQVTAGTGSYVTEIIKDGGVQVLKEVTSNTREVFTNLSDGIVERGKDLIPDVPSVPDLGFKNPFSGLFSGGTSNAGTTNPAQTKLVSDGGLAGKAADFLGLGVFFSGANNIKNFGVASWTGQELRNFNTKYGAQTAVVGEKKGNILTNNPLTRTIEKVVSGGGSSSSKKNKPSSNSQTTFTPVGFSPAPKKSINEILNIKSPSSSGGANFSKVGGGVGFSPAPKKKISEVIKFK